MFGNNSIARPRIAALVALALIQLQAVAPVGAGDLDDPPALDTVEVPLPENLGEFVADHDAAVRLGKALFWDAQVGSDGKVACATCHYSAGGDARTGDGTVNAGPNGVIDVDLPLDPSDFPFDHDDIVGSQGVAPRTFNAIVAGSAVDDCDGELNGALQTTGRNSPPSINAIFHRHNFWDGRANRVFNGVDGSGDEIEAIWVRAFDGTLAREAVSLEPASAASQAVGPPNSDVEMACAGRTFADLGAKMISIGLIPLGKQMVATDDSVLGPWSASPAPGLATSYHTMIEEAFRSAYTSDDLVPDGSGFTQKEANFSLFWGLAVMLYESTLIADNTRFDRWRMGIDDLTRREKRGLKVFNGDGRCDQCHHEAEFSNASIQNGGNGRAFTNTAVRPISEDVGRGDGEFKSSHLRNIALSGPYFHNGGYLTLRQVMDFYNRGGDIPSDATDSQVRELELSAKQQNQVVAFMLTLTDDDARCDAAPFDHPSLELPNGPTLVATGAGGLPEAACIQPWLTNGDPKFHFRLNP